MQPEYNQNIWKTIAQDYFLRTQNADNSGNTLVL